MRNCNRNLHTAIRPSPFFDGNMMSKVVYTAASREGSILMGRISVTWIGFRKDEMAYESI